MKRTNLTRDRLPRLARGVRWEGAVCERVIGVKHEAESNEETLVTPPSARLVHLFREDIPHSLPLSLCLPACAPRLQHSQHSDEPFFLLAEDGYQQVEGTINPRNEQHGNEWLVTGENDAVILSEISN